MLRPNKIGKHHELCYQNPNFCILVKLLKIKETEVFSVYVKFSGGFSSKVLLCMVKNYFQMPVKTKMYILSF